jgi:hypothetical protein
MKALLNKNASAISLFAFQIVFLTGCQTPYGPAILATGSPEEIRQQAIADARADIGASGPRIAITGGFAAWPTGVPEEYFKTVMRYPSVPLPCGCTSPWLKEAAIYAEAYNLEILPHLLKQNEIQQP